MTPAEFFQRLLDETAATIAHPGALALPSDELHTEILLPLLPSMLHDDAIRNAWVGHARGFFSKLHGGRAPADAMPLWEPADFEIHVTASYLAGPDAKALADTLLSEESLRDMTAALMNQVLDVIWPLLPRSAEPEPSVAAFVPPLEIEIPAAEEIAIEPSEEEEFAPEPMPERELEAPVPALQDWQRTHHHRPWQWTTNNPLRRPQSSGTPPDPFARHCSTLQ